MKVEPFQIDVPAEVLEDLRDRVRHTRWPDEVADVAWDQGTNLSYMKELTEYWQNRYDWRKQEADLNRLAQFKTDIDGVAIHFIHERGHGPHPMPLVLTHGWPDTCFRFYKVIPMLTDPEKHSGTAEDAFDVVAPSLPGFGFSGHQALTADDVADLWAKLMAGLGYRTYAAAGGDLGTDVTKSLAFQHPEAVIAVHLTDGGFSPGRKPSRRYRRPSRNIWPSPSSGSLPKAPTSCFMRPSRRPWLTP